MARSKTGEAISPARRTPTARKMLRRFIAAANQRSDLAAWKRGRAVLGYITGTSVIALAAQLDVTRGAINRWLQWYEALGVEGLVTTGRVDGSIIRMSTRSGEDQFGPGSAMSSRGLRGTASLRDGSALQGDWNVMSSIRYPRFDCPAP
jgi:hypothetical protein